MIIFIAIYVVGWQVGLPINLLVVVISPFAISLDTYELLVRCFDPVRALFGMLPNMIILIERVFLIYNPLWIGLSPKLVLLTVTLQTRH